MLDSSLANRIGTGIVLFVAALAIILIGGPLLILLALLCFLVLNFEFFSFATSYSKERCYLLLASVSLIPLLYLYAGFYGFALGIVFSSMLVLIQSILSIDGESHQPQLETTLMPALLGVSYTGVLGAALVVVSHRVPGAELLCLLFAVIGADTLAYFGGRAIGGRKLAPRISPNKTCSGAICGLLGAVAGFLLGAYLFSLPLSYTQQVGLAVIIGVLSIFGDLAESLMKRMFGVKDSGSILPGHGGLLDRLDGLLFAVPVLLLIA